MKNLSKIVSLVSVALLSATAAHAARDAISTVPLHLVSNADPNVFIEMDDSGSMDWEYLTVPSWHACAYDVSNPYDDEDRCEDGEQINDGYFHSITHTTSITKTLGVVTNVAITSVSDIGFAVFFDSSDNWDGNNCASWDAEAGMEGCSIYTESEMNSLFGVSSGAWRGYAFLPFHYDWRGLSSDFNVLWFNPEEDYIPWVGSTFANTGGFTLADGDPSAMRSSPLQNTDGYTDTRDVSDLISGEDVGFQYVIWLDGHGFDGSYPKSGTDINRNDTDNGIVDLWDDYVRYTVIKSGGDYALDVDYITYSADATTGVLTWNKTDVAVKGLADTDEVTIDGETVGSGKTVREIVLDIANWYQYSRRRSFVAKNAVGQVIQSNSNIRFGLGFIKKAPGSGGTMNTYTNRDATGAAADTYKARVDVPTASPYTTHNDTLLEQLYFTDLAGISRGGTPLREGFKDVYEYFSHSRSYSDNPIANACQKHFLVAFTDGHYNNDAIDVPNTASDDYDGDGQTDMLADFSRMMYLTDLDGDCTNNEIVSPTHPSDTNASYIPSACTGDVVDDGLVQQHLVTYTIAFGLQGNLYDDPDDADDWPDHYGSLSGAEFTPAVNTAWATLSGDREDPNKIDDMWHAAYNAGGEFFSATSPQAVIDALNDTLQSIQDQTSSSAAVAASTGELRTGAQLYKVFFDSTDWSGNIQAFDLDTTTGAVIEPEVWDGRDLLDARRNDDGEITSERTILTYSDASGAPGGGVAFQYTATSPVTRIMSTSQKAVLGSEALVQYIRGSGENNTEHGGTYRKRDHILGDIINSTPIYVGAPFQRFVGSSYSSFKSTHSDRTPMIYVGANDGMMHGFNAETGAEVFAYVPAEVYSNLPSLATTTYGHKYYVNGSPTAADVYADIGGAEQWRTVLTSGLGAGGKAIFALDITDPNGDNGGDAVSESGNVPSNVVLWEINNSSTGMTNLGYTFSSIAVAKMKNGKWAAIFGNGYHSADGKASLFIVDIEDGSVIKEIVAEAGPDNGLSSPTAIDYDGDDIVDYIYAGDLKGNMWKFDVTGNLSQWDVAFNGYPLLTADTGQAITTAPEVTEHTEGGFMVLFGTGKFFEDGDEEATGLDPQAFYGIWDDNPSSGGRNGRPYDTADLQEQTILAEITTSVGDEDWEIRFTSSNTVDWTAKKGWYLELSYSGSEGERVIFEPLVRNGRVIFVTMTPKTAECEAGADGWLMELDAYTGAPLTSPPLDLNGDGEFTVADTNYSDDAYDGMVGSGHNPKDDGGDSGLLTRPTVVRTGEDDGSEMKYISMGDKVQTMFESGTANSQGRQSWRILTNN